MRLPNLIGSNAVNARLRLVVETPDFARSFRLPEASSRKPRGYVGQAGLSDDLSDIAVFPVVRLTHELATAEGSGLSNDRAKSESGRNARIVRSLWAGLAVLCSILGTACQSEYKTVLDPLGPVPGGKSFLFYPQVSTSISSSCPPGQGSLLVMTPTGMSYAGPMMYFPHLSYFIESANGWPVRCVANHRTRTDEIPQLVELPAGRYTLVAEADGLGKVNVPLQIDNGTLTKVVLQRFRGENDVW